MVRSSRRVFLWCALFLRSASSRYQFLFALLCGLPVVGLEAKNHYSMCVPAIVCSLSRSLQMVPSSETEPSVLCVYFQSRNSTGNGRRREQIIPHGSECGGANGPFVGSINLFIRKPEPLQSAPGFDRQNKSEGSIARCIGMFWERYHRLGSTGISITCARARVRWQEEEIALSGSNYWFQVSIAPVQTLHCFRLLPLQDAPSLTI